MDYKLWDVKTVSPADFTVEYIITEQAWNNFLQKPENLNNPNRIEAFVAYIRDIIESQVEK